MTHQSKKAMPDSQRYHWILYLINIVVSWGLKVFISDYSNMFSFSRNAGWTFSKLKTSISNLYLPTVIFRGTPCAWSDKALRRAIVIRELLSLHWEYLEITLVVPLISTLYFFHHKNDFLFRFLMIKCGLMINTGISTCFRNTHLILIF